MSESVSEWVGESVYQVVFDSATDFELEGGSTGLASPLLMSQ